MASGRSKKPQDRSVHVLFGGEEMSELLRILENEIQIAALSFLGIVYIIRLIWLFRFAYHKERTFPKGSTKAGIIYSMMNVAMPWAMESVRKKPGFYAQFAIFHVGVAAAISATFIIPYWPDFFKIKAVVILFQVSVGAALVVGLTRLFRRISNPSVRLISSLDDYASLILMILFFVLTAFLIVYVPFSKIGHYLYYPFTRYFLGKTMGHRGTLPRKKSRKTKGADSSQP
jgi:hypothetical protein